MHGLRNINQVRANLVTVLCGDSLSVVHNTRVDQDPGVMCTRDLRFIYFIYEGLDSHFVFNISISCEGIIISINVFL